MIDTHIMQDASEIVHYDTPHIPLFIKKTQLSEYTDMRALCHWHEDIELIYIINGEMTYDINAEKILLKEKDCLVINSRQMHYGHSNMDYNCTFICILFHPSLLSENNYLYENYVLPVIQNTNIEYLHFDSQEEAGLRIRHLAQQICSIKEKHPIAYEFEAIGYINILWSILYNQFEPLLRMEPDTGSSDLQLQRKMISYIHQHYYEQLTLDDIAQSGNISRSKCCIIFKRYLHQSPIDFLNAYRLEVCCHLLKNTDSNITQIATACGFNHLSYFSKIFLRKYGCTPSAYRHSY